MAFGILFGQSKQNGKRGQTALEYLMTYGWALLIIIIVAAALFALGILNPATYAGKTCTGFQQLSYQEHRYGTDGSLVVIFKNGIGKNIATLTSATWTPEGGAAVGPTAQGQTNIPPEATFNVTFSAGVLPTGIAGAAYKGKLDIVYNTPAIQGHMESGTCTGKYE
jgi:hypothetical protein